MEAKNSKQVVVTAVEGPLSNGHYKVVGTANGKPFWAMKVLGRWEAESPSWLTDQERRLVGAAANQAVRKAKEAR